MFRKLTPAISVAPQIGLDDVAEAARQGVKLIINNRRKTNPKTRLRVRRSKQRRARRGWIILRFLSPMQASASRR